MEHEQIRRSIRDIIVTPLGQRLVRRDYGSRVIEYFGENIGAKNNLRIASAIMEAVDKWEKRVKITKIDALAANNIDTSSGKTKFLIRYTIIKNNINDTLEIEL